MPFKQKAILPKGLKREMLPENGKIEATLWQRRPNLPFAAAISICSSLLPHGNK